MTVSTQSSERKSSTPQKEFFSPETLLGTFRNNLTLLKLALGLLLALYFFSGITIVRYEESAVLVRLGKVMPPARTSGLMIAFPPPIDRIYKFPTQQIQELKLDAWVPSAERLELWHRKVRSEAHNTPMNDMEDPSRYLQQNFPWPTMLHPVLDGYSLTGDANIIEGAFTIRYRIVDAIQYYLTLHHEKELLSKIAYQAIARTVAEMSVDSIFSDQRGLFTSETAVRIQRELDRLQTGIRLQGFEINTLTPPAQVLNSFQEVVNAQVENRTQWEQAQSDAATLYLQTTAETRKILLEAEAQRQNRVSAAQGKAAAFATLQQEASQNPSLFRSRVHTETLKRIFRNLTTTTLLPADSSNLQFWLPQESLKDE